MRDILTNTYWKNAISSLIIRLLYLVFTFFAILLTANMLWAAKPNKCETAGDFLILKHQSYALCATAACFSFNQLAYCKCDDLKGDSISIPFDYDDDQNICTLNQQGQQNGYEASTFSFPTDVTYQKGNMALYTCPGEANKDKYGMGYPARGTYAQCDGGLCFQSTRGKSFPGFNGRLSGKEIICSCPFATICEKLSENPNGYQISGPYEGECDPAACEKCNAAALTENECETLPNPVSQIGIEEDIPVGAATGTPEILSCLLLGKNNVPEANSCFCQCKNVDQDGICTEWAVHNESPLKASCD